MLTILNSRWWVFWTSIVRRLNDPIAIVRFLTIHRDIAIHAKEILRVRERLNMIYQKHLTKPHTLDEIEKIMERDLFMGAETALEMGIVDEILSARKRGES